MSWPDAFSDMCVSFRAYIKAEVDRIQIENSDSLNYPDGVKDGSLNTLENLAYWLDAKRTQALPKNLRSTKTECEVDE